MPQPGNMQQLSLHSLLVGRTFHYMLAYFCISIDCELWTNSQLVIKNQSYSIVLAIPIFIIAGQDELLVQLLFH